ncbi:MAG: type II toxin-antitoxin system RelE/ParE family toxin [Bacteroidales bacterium]|nr:type II toxin-antitoxin system RelE/ParE family toxin [Bacteroidales bacterium]
MEKPIEVVLLKQAEYFVDEIEAPVRKKFFISMRKTKDRIFGDWFKKLTDTNDLFEFRVEYKGKFYRLFSFWDSREGKQTLIVCTHGLIKKSNRTPKSEIEKAEDIKDKYFRGLI